MKFQVDRIKIVRVPLLAEFKNAILRKMHLKFAFLPTGSLIEAFNVEDCYFENKIFLGTRPVALYFWKSKAYFKQKKSIFSKFYIGLPFKG